MTKNITKQNSTTSVIHYNSFLSFAGPIVKKKWKNVWNLYSSNWGVPNQQQARVWKIPTSTEAGSEWNRWKFLSLLCLFQSNHC